jgi:hypothetical protein
MNIKLKPKSDLTLESDEPHDSANANAQMDDDFSFIPIEFVSDQNSKVNSAFTQKNINTGKFPNLLRRSELLY